MWRASEKTERTWDHTATLAATIINSAPNFGKRKRRPVRPEQLHPFMKNRRRQARRVSRKVQLAVLDQMFPERK